MEEPKSLSNIVAFQDIPNEITNNQKNNLFLLRRKWIPATPTRQNPSLSSRLYS